MGEKDVSLILEEWSIKEKLDTTTMRVRTEADFAIFLKLPLLSRLVFLNALITERRAETLYKNIN